MHQIIQKITHRTNTTRYTNTHSGNSRLSARYKEVIKLEQSEEYLRKYYRLQDVRLIFTTLINRSALVDNITFLDFKLRHFKIMNNYHYQQKVIRNPKNKEENNLTASHSLIADKQQL